MAAPLLSLLLLGGTDLARYTLAVHKVMGIGFAVSDVASQYKADELSDKALDQIYRISSENLSSYVSGSTGVTMLTSVYLASNGAVKVRWQCKSATVSGWSSKIGSPGGAASVDKNMLLDENDNIIISEVYYKYTPLFKLFSTSTIDIYSKAMFRPRLGGLTTKPCS
ncbi:Flp pilus assembly protein TadG [Methylopila capsulata]|uniref:Flp pilus assembly protein TadG n=1 Tax=Methylopila capsulata TaxID=61654 RepID=A0ABS2T2G6_9HYPH|nr:Flp pilus assembly protein TadG [Methylopila capsulata]